MSNQEIHIHTHTGVDGIVHLDIPVGIVNQDIDLTISYTSPKDNNSIDSEREQILANAKPASDLSEFRGVIELTEDPLEYQRRIRDEW